VNRDVDLSSYVVREDPEELKGPDPISDSLLALDKRH